MLNRRFKSLTITIQTLRSCGTVLALAAGLTAAHASTDLSLVSIAEPTFSPQLVNLTDTLYLTDTPLTFYGSYVPYDFTLSNINYSVTNVGQISVTTPFEAYPVVDLDPPFVREPLSPDTGSVVPEPSTLALMGLGLVFVALVARRRRC
jgi:hypothetical protein